MQRAISQGICFVCRCLFIGMTGAAPLVHAEAALPKPLPAVTAAVAGDGKPAHLSVQAIRAHGSDITGFRLSVGSVRVRETMTEDDSVYGCRGVRVLPVGLRQRIIDVVMTGYENNETHYLFGFVGGRLARFGTLSATITGAPGDGTLAADVPQMFWIRRDRFRVDWRKLRIIRLPHGLYPVDQAATATNSFPLRRSGSTHSAITATAAPGERFVVEHYSLPDGGQESAPEERGWYRIRTQSGKRGWATLESFRDKQKGLPFFD